MILYAIPVSTYSAKVRIALAAKGVDFEMQPPPGGYSTPEYMALVPLGTIPAINDDGFIISESDAIIEYLEDKYPEPALLPGSAAERAYQRYLSRFHDLWLEPPLRATFAQLDPATRDQAVLDDCLDRYQGYVDTMERLIDPVPYLGGATLGMADCAFPATFTLAELMLPAFGRETRYGDKVSAWMETAYAHPAVKAVTDDSRQATLDWMNSG